MPDIVIIEIKNKLAKPKIRIEVYHYVTGVTDIIPFNRSISLPLRTFISDQNFDFIRINLEKDPGEPVLTSEIHIDLPAWIVFDFFSPDETRFTLRYPGDRVIIIVPPCPPTWKLKLPFESV